MHLTMANIFSISIAAHMIANQGGGEKPLVLMIQPYLLLSLYNLIISLGLSNSTITGWISKKTFKNLDIIGN